jgi:hypothetical protein
MKTEKTARARKSEEERIADLEARIAQLRARAERKKVKRDPALKFVSQALRAVDKAHTESSDTALRQALGEARATLSACLALHGVGDSAAKGTLIPRGRGARRLDAEVVLQHVQAHPGQRGEEIAVALSTDTKTLRPTMLRLISERKVRTAGRARGMQYFGV